MTDRKITEENHMAIGNDQLGGVIGEQAICPNCKKLHKVEFGTARDWLPDGSLSEPRPSNMGYVKCGDDVYIVAVGGKKINYK